MGIFSEAFEERVAELETEVQQLKAELRQYQPSDGMMYKLLGLNEAIRDAAKLLRAAGTVHRDSPEYITEVDDWLALPVVHRAVASPLAQAKVKP